MCNHMRNRLDSERTLKKFCFWGPIFNISHLMRIYEILIVIKVIKNSEKFQSMANKT